jgi:hypothetical protein
VEHDRVLPADDRVLDDALQVEPRLKKHAEAGDDLFGGWSNKTMAQAGSSTQMNPS